MEKKKIILATPIYPPEIGGPATYIKEICHRLNNAYDITVIAYTSEKNPFPGTNLISVKKEYPLLLRLLIYTYKIWKELGKSELVYVQNAVASGLPTAIACTLRRKPFILKFVGDEAWERASQRKATEKKLEDFLKNPDKSLYTETMMAIQGFVLRRASIVTTPSAYLLDAIAKTYKLNKEKTIVNYNASEDNSSKIDNSKRIPYQIVTVARLVVWKGVDKIIEAISLLATKFPTMNLVILGDGPEMDNLKAQVAKLKLANHVTFRGMVSEHEVTQTLQTSSLFILNSTYEGLPHVVLASFGNFIPVIATNISGTNEVVKDGETGLTIEVGNITALSSAIEKIFNDSMLRERLTRNAQNLLQTQFSWKNHLSNLELMVKKLTIS